MRPLFSSFPQRPSPQRPFPAATIRAAVISLPQRSSPTATVPRSDYSLQQPSATIIPYGNRPAAAIPCDNRPAAATLVRTRDESPMNHGGECRARSARRHPRAAVRRTSPCPPRQSMPAAASIKLASTPHAAVASRRRLAGIAPYGLLHGAAWQESRHMRSLFDECMQ